MTLKTILTCLTNGRHLDAMLNVAVPLARRHGAHLVGLHTLDSPKIYPGTAVHLPPDFMTSMLAQAREESRAIQAAFEARIKGEPFVGEYRELKTRLLGAADLMVDSARAADLVIMAREDPEEDRYDQRHAPHAVIRQSGRPVIVVPHGHDGGEIGRKILVGWSDTREAARAAHDALALAAPGAEIVLLKVARAGEDAFVDAGLMDISAALSRHGHSVTVEHVDPAGAPVGEVLTQRAFECGADLVATGAFGHSRAYDFVIGATTTALLEAAPLPVLFSK